MTRQTLNATVLTTNAYHHVKDKKGLYIFLEIEGCVAAKLTLFLYPLDQRILCVLPALCIKVVDEEHDDPFFAAL